MLRHRIALLTLLAVVVPASSAQALELGVQDDGRSSAAVTTDCVAIDCGWTRTTVAVGSPLAAQRIRDAHAAGQKIIVTVGGTGTRTRKPTAAVALAYIRSLPRADKYTFVNEPDLSGMAPCSYRWRWMKLRRALGSRLLFGDFSPHAPVTYTARMRKCRDGRLPRSVGLALHPYYPTDPLAARCDWEGGICNLGRIRRVMRAMGIRTELWLDEFGYMAEIGDARIAWLWPRAVSQAQRHRARVLIAYTAQGGSWDTRPRPLAWCSLTRGRACPGAQRPVEHREPAKQDDDERDGHVRHLDPVVPQMLAYASE